MPRYRAFTPTSSSIVAPLGAPMCSNLSAVFERGCGKRRASTCNPRCCFTASAGKMCSRVDEIFLMTTPIIAVFAGGTSAEREVSLGSGKASAAALAQSFPTQFFEITANGLPAGVDARRHVVFSTLHGTFGEDG